MEILSHSKTKKKKRKRKDWFPLKYHTFCNKSDNGSHKVWKNPQSHPHSFPTERYIHARKGNSHNPRRFVSPDGIFTSSQKKNIRKGQHNRRWMIKSNCALDKNDELQKFCSIYFLKTAAFQAFSCEKKFQLIKTTSRCFQFNLEAKPSEYTDSASVIRVWGGYAENKTTTLSFWHLTITIKSSQTGC